MALERGTLINNRYRVVEILGQGGMGAVYRAVDENLGVNVALKENLFTTEEYARQFKREAIILASLRHPNLTRVTDHFVIEGQGQYLVMDYVEGEDLRERMDRIGVLNDEDVIMIGAAICDALSYLETQSPPIVHRDIKPGNVKITPDGHIFLVDFGLAKEIRDGQMTTTGARAMTPGYSPPEQYGTAPTDNRSDIYSLGATLYAALTGMIPEDALARAMNQIELTPIRRINSNVSRSLASVIEKSLTIQPDERYPNADEFERALLKVRGYARRKTGEYTVEPPPGVVKYPTGISSNSIRYNAYREQPYKSLENSGMPIPVSTPLDRRELRRKPGSRSGRIWRYVLFVVIFLIAGTIVSYLFNPDLSMQALAWINTTSSQTFPVVLDQITPTDTHTLSPTSTVKPSVTPSATNIPTSSPSSTPISTATSTEVLVLPSATVMPTQLGGGGRQVAFASDRSGTMQIWLIDNDGSNAQQITDMPEGACQPSWSSDGSRLVFVSPCESNQREYKGAGLFIINSDGTGLMPLPNVPGGDFDPSWSPSGNYIAFTSLRNGGRARIYVINLDDNSVERLSEQYSYDRQPAWSNDASELAFITTRKGSIQVWTMDADGSDQELFSRSGDAINSYPVWSVDGELILFTQVEEVGRVPSIVAASYDDGEYTEFKYDLGPIPVREAKYSPDGLWLVFESWPEGSNHDIYIMSASGAGRTQLTDWPSFEFDPVWRPTVK